jgi:hypothetical protein
MWNFEIKQAEDVPSFASIGKYEPIWAKLDTLKHGEWLLLTGFADESQLAMTQSGFRSSSRDINLRKTGRRIKSRRVNQGGKLELWITIVPMN